jgi:hypothetical protein
MTNDASADVGPAEMMLIGFPGNRFDGSILPALQELVAAGTVRVIDLVVVRKDADGAVTALEVADLDGDDATPFDEVDGEVGELFSDEDLALAGEQLEPDSSAVFVLWEDSWAMRLSAAVAGCGGRVLMHDRIPAAVMTDVAAAGTG